MGDFLTFRKLITIQVIQILFWIGSIGIVIAALGAIASDEALGGVLLLVFGLLYIRILCEFLIVVFRMHDTLNAIKKDTASLPAAAGAGGITAGQAAAAAEPAAAESPQLAEGWYNDPDRPGHKRWWDGTAWGRRDDEAPSG